MDHLLVALTILATLLAPLLIPAYRRYKSRPLSNCRIEQEIAEIVKRTGKYEFTFYHLGPISNQLRNKFKDRLPELLRSEDFLTRSSALGAFLSDRREWTRIRRGNSFHQIIGYKVPYRYRRKSP